MISFTQGDVATLDLKATNGQGNGIDLTGATFSTSMLGPQGATIIFGNGQHTANPDQVNFRGQFTLALASSDTMLVAAGTNKEIVTLITISANGVYYHGPSQLNVLLPTPTR